MTDIEERANKLCAFLFKDCTCWPMREMVLKPVMTALQAERDDMREQILKILSGVTNQMIAQEIRDLK